MPYVAAPGVQPPPCNISDAIGQKENRNVQGDDAAVLTGMGVADAPAFLGLKIANLFGAPDKVGDESLSVINEDGSGNGFGCGVRDTWADLAPADPDNDTWTKHLARRAECFTVPFDPPE